MTIAEIIASILLILATILVIATVVALWRAPDALTRVNLLGPTVGLAVPLLLVAKLVVDFAENGFSLWSLVRVLIACFGVWIIGSVGSFYMGRSIYGVTVTDVKYAKRMHQRADTVEGTDEDV
ncbi:Na+/H+ antiporter subunit G [Corynebacterium sp. HMSC05E07]|uniref:Na+/H+ antiporter subunit G n=1 Tax=Corynebacterium sp. HMSC05E07 TaxID=1581117 RepID=UPI0008A5C6CD|nr:Na+/H+ antiporter subunit G [Corynebacterium sp. HMSC05E07]OFT63392.1 Na+/H+ antiporter subunit G [Corynebacterium sp. HMSC05E07]